MEAAARAEPAQLVAWEPQRGPQSALVTCPVFDVLYGGARGGGKTDGMLGDWAIHAGDYGEYAIGLMVRRTRTELIETIERSREIYSLIGAKYHEQDKLWRMPGGGRLRFAYLERDADAESYQGHSYTRVYVEEMGNFPSQAPIRKLMATLRSAHGVPVGFRASANPGGPGHGWIKHRYIDPAPLGWDILTDPETGLERVYIPSRVTDNHVLMAQDPGYIARLKASGSQELVKAWLEGDWSVIAGAFFGEFSTEQHVVAPCELPADWARFRAADWGSAKPFSVGWYAVSDGAHPRFPRGALVRYREWYGMRENEPNVGLKMTAEEVADGIIARETEALRYAVLDPAAFSQDGGPSIAERINDKLGKAKRVQFHRADNARVGKRGSLGGWDQVRARLKGDGEQPALYVFSTCTHLIRTLPALQHDEARPEDVDTEGEDHAGDELRYACMSRPYVAVLAAPKPPAQTYLGTPQGRIVSTMTFAQLRDSVTRARQRD